MTYKRVEITLRDAAPDKFRLLMEYMLKLGLYEKASTVVKEVSS